MSTQSGDTEQEGGAAVASTNGAPSGFDLTRQAAHLDREQGGRWIEVRGPDGRVVTYKADGEQQPRPVRALVYGTYSQRFKQAQREHRRQLTRKGDVQLTDDEAEQAQRRLYATLVGDWEGFFQSGRPISCTPDHVVRSFKMAPWWLDQVIAEASDHAGFSSSSTDS